MTAARMQRYALHLAAHDYDIVYKSSLKHANAYGLSKLPLKTGKTSPHVVDICYMDHMETQQVYMDQILQELHVGHIGVVKMKGLARSYVW